MSNISIIDRNRSYTFADYFSLNAEPDEIFANFDYHFEVKQLVLPKSDRTLTNIDNLKQRFSETLSSVNLTSERARREFLIAPVLQELIHYTKAKIKVSYSLNVSPQLKGELDYYIHLHNQLLVIEAKNADLQKGFVQLGVELIAIAQAELTEQQIIYGAVSLGNIWQFGILQREQMLICQDINLYQVPGDLEKLLPIIIGILES